MKDVDTGRSLQELCLPSRQSVFQVLNAPSPQSFYFTTKPPFAGYGFDALNFRCCNESRSRTYCLPTEEEVIYELLREKGVEPKKDEKRQCYELAFNLFPEPSLQNAANSLAGTRGRIIRKLATGSSTCNQLKSSLQLGASEIPRDRSPKPLPGFPSQCV